MPRVFVGDVQGCADEFDVLVERARGELGPDFELWLAGDLVNRGPESLRVLRRVRDLMESGRARAVLGNHDLALVSIHLGLRRLRPRDTFGDVLSSSAAADWIDWLRRLPLALRGEAAGEPLALVHASVHPDWTLDELVRQAAGPAARLAAPDRRDAAELLAASAADDADRDVLDRLTSARSVDARGRFSSAPPARPVDAWHRQWSMRDHPYGVVYGHWAVQRLHVAPGLRGLDTGCVHHGRGCEGALTAWLPEAQRLVPAGADVSPFSVPDDRFWHVPARRRYYVDTPEEPGARAR